MDTSKKIVLAVAGLLAVGLIVWGVMGSYGSSSKDSQKGISDQKTIQAGDWVKGPETAKVTLIEYTDFECPACGAYYPVVNGLVKKFPNDLRLVIRHYPLVQIHKNALPAARAAEAAGRQGKFWEMYDVLFPKQAEWAKVTDPKDIFAGYADSLGLNKDQFLKDWQDGSIDENINRGRTLGDEAGITGTPTFFLDGEKIDNPSNQAAFEKLIQEKIGAPASSQAKTEEGQAVHEHADLKVYLRGKAIDFSQAKYQSTDDHKLDEHVHLHDGNGSIIHKHWSNVTLGQFFKSLGMELTRGCFRNDAGEAFCTGPGEALRVYVNGKPDPAFDTLNFQDGDRILVTFGSEQGKALQAQIDSVSNDACIYSEKCPERGKPPTEECVGGLGTDCKE